MKKVHIWFCGLSLLAACTKKDTGTGSNRLIAQVYNKSLYLRDLEGMFPLSATAQDSQQIIRAYTDRWVRENLLMAEAERNVPKDLNIDELVQKYRESLILNSYEEKLTREGLDTAITEAELQQFYEKNREQYQLETPILRCYFLKMPKNFAQQDSLEKWWNSPRSGNNAQKMRDFAAQNAMSYFLEDSVWHKLDDIAQALPKGSLTSDNVSSDKELTTSDENARYYFRVLGMMSKQEIAPLSFIKGQASKYILHQRKMSLLERKKQEMYEAELRKNNVKIY